MADYQRYEASGEINFTVTDAQTCVDAVLKSFGNRIHIDRPPRRGDRRSGRRQLVQPAHVQHRAAAAAQRRGPHRRRRRRGGRAGLPPKSPRRQRHRHERRRTPRSTSTTSRACSPPTATGCCARRRWQARRCAPPRRRSRRVRSSRRLADDPPRTVIWVAGRGNAETAGSILAAALGGSAAAPIVVGSEAPPWIGALDVLVVAGDDPGDPALVGGGGDRPCAAAPEWSSSRPTRAAARRHRRSRRGARAAVCGTRRLRPVPLSGRRPCGRCAWSILACGSTSPRSPTNSTPRRCATAPAVNCSPTRRRRWPTACRGARWCSPATTRRRWRWPVTVARSCCGSAHQPMAAVGLSDVVVALRTGLGGQSDADRETALFHDEEIDGPLPARVRTFVLTLDDRTRRWWRRGWPATTTSSSSGPRTCPTWRSRRCNRGVPNNNWRCWPSGWRWRPSICDWFEDRRVNLLRGALRTYAWGSRTAIADFTGRPSPTAHPEAELWFGAHPGDPALAGDGLRRGVAAAGGSRADPEGQLGAAVRNRFGDALPFLMKVLAADEPLSLQAHPSAQQAEEGFAREDRLGIPVSSPIRNYRDRSHKPELLVALHTFEALAGFRPAPSRSS